ncbi:unnamed protein product [Arabidopsis lyrata]|uniref:putative FBD-associated F-box protein At5g56560 n=1 Tax=Arabidopsis lyrata subsp. lyrata TaxID=81972 RepID=UPI000A29CB44|nr:putative FBD-associated F-box protein At5g56560 [Arabidopsis lyrata subsp. lyrata]CAH8279900.1 unnamed protein product [Arabidopsis lyrata]|eukprot:XP_020871195.1 putative FBD-associated F-box protein At5g56560 [Arabidopsis lyrata subsp. lyrata]
MEKKRLSDLPDELLLKILSSLPMFKETLATRLISKRWKGPWKLVPDVMFDDDDTPFKSFETFMSFVYGSLLSTDAQILDRLHLKLNQNYSASDINFWVQIAVNRSVRELRIDLFGKTLELPCCLCSCRTLKELTLHGLCIKIVPPSFRLSSLEALHLLSVKFLGDESVASLLKICPVLEHLVVDQIKNDNVKISNIDVPTLRNLSIRNSKGKHGKRTYVEGSNGFVIKAPSLTELNFEDTLSNFTMFEPMPEVIKANIQVICDQSENFIGSLTSIQHLSLCSLTSKTPYPACTVFSSLKHLELCTCSAGWANLLACILNAAQELRSLKLKSKHSAKYSDPMSLWKEPTVVPDCLSKHLEILEWRQYEGTEQERNVAEYTLANATCLKMATFSTRCRNKNHRMLKKLKSMDRVSKTCQLVFD